MGYITTISIYNDGCDLLKPNAEKLAEILTDACLGKYTRHSSTQVGLGGHGNLITVQKPKHADVKTVYVHAGNTVTEMNVYSNKAINLLQSNPKFFDELVKVMEDKVKELKELKKNYEKNKA